MTTYLSSGGQDRLALAQRVIELHIKIDATGRCLTCQETEPCSARTSAHDFIARCGMLPQRNPFATTLWRLGLA